MPRGLRWPDRGAGSARATREHSPMMTTLDKLKVPKKEKDELLTVVGGPGAKLSKALR
jgi:hypothetical protein